MWGSFDCTFVDNLLAINGVLSMIACCIVSFLPSEYLRFRDLRLATGAFEEIKRTIHIDVW